MRGDLFEAYLKGEATPFFEGHFTRAEDRARACRVARPVAPALSDALAAQNARYAPSARREEHLAALRRGAAAVVTGQQVGLFLGPLYTIYKAATAVRLARALEAETRVPVVPIYWLQTEDHDLPEIAHTHVPGARGEPRSLEIPELPGDSVSVAHRVLPAAVSTCLDELAEELARWPHAAEHLARLAQHYYPGAGWGKAFAGVLAALFAPEGLVLIDPRDPSLAPLAVPVHRRAILDARPIADALLERVRALRAAGFEPTVHVRPSAPLSFFHPDGPQRPRFRLEVAPGGYSEVGGGPRVHDERALLDALESRPASFSTSALLRPLLQDAWLPTAAYVGGPAEVAYFAQLAPLYAAFGTSMPLVVPRVRVRILEDKPRRLLARRSLTPSQACRPLAEALVLARGSTDEPSGEVVSRRLLGTFDQSLDALRPRLRPAGPEIDKALGRMRGNVARAVAKLGRKVDAARLRRDTALVDDVQRLQGWLCPGGRPQERVYGMSYYAARHGERAFLEKVLSVATPFGSSLEDLPL